MSFLVLVIYAVKGLTWLVILDAVLSWIQEPHQMPRRLTRHFMEPLYAPIHAVIDPRKTGGMDLSPIIVLVLLRLIESALTRAIY